MPTADQLKTQADEFRCAGRGDRAFSRYLQAQDFYLTSDNVLEATQCMHMLGVTLVFEDRADEGQKALKAALEAYQQLRNTLGIAQVQRDQGIACLINRRYLTALDWLIKSRKSLLNSDQLAERAITEAKIGRLYALDGEYGQVDGCFNEAYLLLSKDEHIAYQITANIDNAFACLELAQIGHMSNHIDTAWALLVQSGEMLVQKRQVLQITGLRVRLAINQKDWHQARAIFKSEFLPLLDDLSPGNQASLNREIDIDQLKKDLSLP
ncbi:hypothetical protein H0W80_03750 [Candidatus Saccharibacteria bacterium]|nr:hypothetical protein [Candidatus Saccharibacteria bacterium]